MPRPRGIPELLAEKARLERRLDLLASGLAFVGAVLIVGFILFGKGL